MNMRIAIFTDTFLPNTNGVVNSIISLINELTKNGHKILLVTVGGNIVFPNHNVEVIAYSGITIPTYKDYQLVFPKFNKTFKALKRFKPDVVHVQTPFGIGWDGILSAKRLKIPIIGTHHTFYADYTKHIFFVELKLIKLFANWYSKVFFNYCDIVTSPSNALLKELKKIGVVKEIIKIPNGIDLSKFKKKKDFKSKYNLKKTVLYMGRVSHEKNINVLIKSMIKVQTKHPDSKLIIVGGGPDQINLENLARKLSVNALFTGLKKGQELLDWVYAGDVFVTASTTENQPMSILEAMGCGRALIGVNAKGVPELIINNKNGLIAKPNNPEDLSRKILKLIEDSSKRNYFEKESLKLIKKYSIKLISPIWENLYERTKNIKK